MKRLKDAISDKYTLEVIECECGFHIGLDASYIDQVGDCAVDCPACGRALNTAVIGAEGSNGSVIIIHETEIDDRPRIPLARVELAFACQNSECANEGKEIKIPFPSLLEEPDITCTTCGTIRCMCTTAYLELGDLTLTLALDNDGKPWKALTQNTFLRNWVRNVKVSNVETLEDAPCMQLPIELPKCGCIG